MSSNNKGKNCPYCRKDIGYSTIIRASYPTKMKCKHCNTLIAYGKTPFLLAIPFGIIILFSILLLAQTSYNPDCADCSGGPSLPDFMYSAYFIFQPQG